MRRFSFAFVPVLLLLAGCDDPADPCAEFGCDVAGVDLAVTSFDMTRAVHLMSDDANVVSPASR